MQTNVASMLENRWWQRQRGEGDYRHWQLRRDGDLLWVYFDKDGDSSSTNTLNAGVMEELEKILDSLDQSPPKTLVFQSRKAGGFCAGADISQFSSFDAQQMDALLERGHGLLDRIEKLPFTTIALIHGHCLGGGLELALACDRRIGIDDNLEMGLPEIQLGLHPGLGGTFRLTGLISPVKAMTMMLTGRPLRGRQTRRAGLVDALIQARHQDAAVAAAAAGKLRRRRQTLAERLLNTRPARQLLARRMHVEASKRAPAEHYPAPGQLVELWRQHGGSRRAMQKAEMRSFASLLQTETSKNLTRVFFLHEGLKQAARGDNTIHHVHVIGAGAMGGDIAAWCALRGCRVTLSDISHEAIGKAVKSVTALCRSKHRTAVQTRETLDRLIADPEGQGIARADLVIEAVPENAALKKSIYEKVEPQLKAGAILASNTSSIPLETMAAWLKQPQRFVGIHFFNPVSKMLIVEVVGHEQLDASIRDQAMVFAGAIGKLPVAVQSYPGFLVNRALTPYLLEAMLLLDEGVDKQNIDAAARDFGMPMGPVELADQVGLDICLHVAEVLEQSLDTPLATIPDWLQDKIKAGELGRKTGQGFYTWKKGRALQDKTVAPAASDAGLQDRLMLPMLNACVECYREGVVDDLDALDAALVFATGFAPFRGGPMHYARGRGFKAVASALEELEAQHGARFRPDPGWQQLS